VRIVEVTERDDLRRPILEFRVLPGEVDIAENDAVKGPTGEEGTEGDVLQDGVLRPEVVIEVGISFT
jgi:hypothetical protein